MLTVEIDQWNKLDRKYNRGANIICSTGTIVGVAVLGSDIARVGLLSMIVAAPAMIGIESVAIVVGIIEYLWPT